VSRLQAVATVITPFWNWHGRHTLKFGVDADRIVYRQFSSRGPIEIRGASGEVLRRVDFQGEPHFGRNNAEYSGYVQDSWKASGQVFVEAGLRFDLDQVLHRSLWSPRLAFSWGPARIPDSKFTAGIGVFYDATSLELLARAQDQERADFFFQSGGPVPPGLPVVTRFFADAKDLTAPLFLNWSAGWQQKLRRGFYLEANLNRRSGRNGWVYTRMPPDGSAPNGYRLESIRRDSYTEVELSLSKMIREKSPWLVSYVRSASHASHVIDFSLDNPIFATQAAGPPDWDAPNRLISWSAFPVPRFKEYTLAYFVEWRSGLPWSSVNQYQQLAGNPNSRRFPDYVCLNLHLERRVRFLHAAWALRAGFNNLTGHWNPTVVQNNLDSAQYGGFAGSQGRVFTGRIRFLGRN
jgi:hypothetical protein